MQLQLEEERIREEFASLVSIDSISYYERRMAEKIRGMFRELGFSLSEDDAGEKLREEREAADYGADGPGGEDQPAGNLYGYLPGTLPGEPILLSAHLDTVHPGHGKQAVFGGDGRITGNGTAVLGADDAAGLLEILEGVRAVLEAGVPHRGIELLFPVAEEAHCRGSRVFDFTRIRAKQAYVLDLSGPVGTAAIEAPTILTFQAEVKGKAAHAGFAPEEGVHAIAVMCDAVTRIPHGRMYAGSPEEMTVNIGSIRADGQSNIVPERCSCLGEIRSCSHEQALGMAKQVEQEFEETAAWYGAKSSVKTELKVHACRTEKDSPVVRRFLRACADLSLPGTLIRTFGGSDNNNFALHGISGIVLSCGMSGVHSLRESIAFSDLVNGACLVADLITDAELP